MRFTKPVIAALRLPEGKSELIAFDDNLPGFGIRLRAGGKRVWIVQYRLGAKQRRLTLGRVEVLDLDEARASARRALSKVGLAIDPQAEEVGAKAAASVTLGVLVNRYLAARKSHLKPRSYVETSRHLLKDWLALHGQPIASIGRADVANRLGILAADNGAVAADRARAALSAFFGWSIREGIATANPVVGTNRPSLPKARERVLSDEELAAIWSACRADDYGAIVRLLMLTGQRREEVAGMEWQEIDEAKALWSLPGRRTKNGRPHEVPLSSAAIDVIAGVHRREGRDLLFGEGEGGFSGWSGAKIGLDARLAAFAQKQFQPWRLHDLRRTVATRLGDLGVQPHVVEALLNHVSGVRSGVAGVYNRALYTAEKRAALTLWGEHIGALLSGGRASVVPFRRQS